MTSLPQGQIFPDLSRASLREDRSSTGSAGIEGYRILEELPRGGQAIVYKALHEATGTKVALKVLPIGLAMSSTARRNFEREVELASSLKHPNIVAILESGIARGQYYFAMEYVRGLSLDEYVGSRSLSLREKMGLLYKICDGMAQAHQRGVIHRDLKPSNILIDDQGEPHVVDFGLAKLAAGSDGVLAASAMTATLTGEIKGTLAYMSPEQAAGRPEQVDVRTDVYALGVMLFQMITGQFPYDISGTALEAIGVIKSAEPVRPRTLIKRLDSDVEAIILKALAKDPGERYQSAAELRHDIGCWLNGQPIVAKSISSWYLLRKMVARHRYTSTVVGLLLIILLAFSFVSYYLYGGSREQSARLQRALSLLRNEEQQYSGLVQQVAFVHMLDLWHAGQAVQMQSVAGYFADGTREAEARQFLADSRPLAEKVAGFRDRLGDRDPFFADFVVAEHLLKEGRRREAAACYSGCLSQGDSGGDQVLRMRAGLRLHDLSDQSSSAEDPNARG